MASPACVGDTLTTSGRIKARREENGLPIAEIEVTATTEHGLAAVAEITANLEASSLFGTG